MRLEILLSGILALAVAGCATYRPLALNSKVTLARSVEHLTVDTRDLPYHYAPAHKFNPANGLDMTEVAMLAVANNPSLRLARDDAQIAYAQAFATGLLPDPQLGYSRDIPYGTPGAVNAFNANIGFQLSSLISHAAVSAASSYRRRKADLDLLWQEWQVIAQARLLFSRSISQQALLTWLTSNRDLLADRYDKEEAALKQGNVSRDSLNGALIAWQDASKQVRDLQRQELQTHQALNALLGLDPGVQLDLVDEPDALGLPDENSIRQMLADLSGRRPDLLALKAGYDAQDESYRQAILEQFPALNLAFSAASDTAGVHTHGFALTMTLPFLNGNRGNVAIQDATRKRLHDEFQFRLNTAYAEADQLLSDRRLLASQLRSAESGMQSMDKTADNAGKALEQGLIDGGSYSQLQSSRIAKHAEVIGLQQSLLEDQIALLTLLGITDNGVANAGKLQ